MAAKAKWARDRKNGTFGSTDNCGGGATGRGDEGGREGSGIVFLEYGATQATDDENARPARHGGLHCTREREGAREGSGGAREHWLTAEFSVVIRLVSYGRPTSVYSPVSSS